MNATYAWSTSSTLGAQFGWYDEAGHGIGRPCTPTSDVRQVRIHSVTKRPNMMGGTPEGQARANVDSWEKLLAFLEKHL